MIKRWKLSKFQEFGKRLLQERQGVWGALWIALLYIAWIKALELLSLSFVAFFVGSPAPQSWEISEIHNTLSAIQFPVLALAAVLFTGLNRWLYPLTRTQAGEIFTFERFKSAYLPGVLQGGLIALSMIAVLTASQYYRYLGTLITYEDLGLILPGLAIKGFSLLLMTAGEEFVFRQKILQKLRPVAARFRSPQDSSHSPSTLEVLLLSISTSLLYLVTKSLQFDLGWMQSLTLFLLSIALTQRTLDRKDYLMGAGYLGALLLIFHPVFSLPIFGQETNGLLLLKLRAPEEMGLPTLDTTSLFETATPTFFQVMGQHLWRLLSGGISGPLSSIAFQFFLLFDILRTILRSRPGSTATGTSKKKKIAFLSR